MEESTVSIPTKHLPAKLKKGEHVMMRGECVGCAGDSHQMKIHSAFKVRPKMAKPAKSNPISALKSKQTGDAPESMGY